jgi:probable HAF family extracellular repeat protein
MSILPRHSLTSLSLFSLIAAAPIATAHPIYSVKDLGAFSPSSGSSALNDAGEVVGTVYDSTNGLNRPVLYRSATGTQVLFDSPYNAYANGVNASGTIVGNMAINANQLSHPFIWDSISGTRDINAALDARFDPRGGHSYVYGIDDLGRALGTWVANYGSAVYGFAYDTSSGIITDVGSLGYGGTQAFAGNNQGQVVGFANGSGLSTHAFVWSASSGMTDIGTDGSLASAASDVNSVGMVSGYTIDIGSFVGGQAFVWTAEGGVERLPFLNGYDLSVSNAIGDDGTVVGSMTRMPQGISIACAWSPDGAALDLNQALDSSGLGYSLIDSYAINSTGQILGRAVFNGQARAVLLTPVPEPTTLAIFGLGATLFTKRRRTSRG